MVCIVAYAAAARVSRKTAPVSPDAPSLVVASDVAPVPAVAAPGNAEVTMEGATWTGPSVGGVLAPDTLELHPAAINAATAATANGHCSVGPLRVTDIAQRYDPVGTGVNGDQSHW